MQMQRRCSDFTREVWVMWRETSGLTSRHLQSVLVWATIIGLPITIYMSIKETGTAHYIGVGLSTFFTLVLLVTFFIATYKVWHRDTTKLGLINCQKTDTASYIQPCLSGLVVNTANRQLMLRVRWFNGTVFDIQLNSVDGNGKIAGSGVNHLTQNLNKNCYAGRFHECTLYLSVSDEVLENTSKASIAKTGIAVDMNLEWQISIPEIGAHFSLKGPQGEFYMLPSRA